MARHYHYETPQKKKKTYQLRSSPIEQANLRKSFYKPRTLFSSPTTTAIAARPVLAPLHQNLRRLPSRLVSMPVFKESEILVGRKRKRVPSGVENVQATPRKVSQSGRRYKRRRPMRDASGEDSEESDVDGLMEVDEDQSSEEYFLRIAPQWRLQQLRKDDLVRLCENAGISGDADTLTKPDIIYTILEARDSEGTLPPSSSPSVDIPDSSDEEQKEDRPIIPLRRRATDNTCFALKRSFSRNLKERSYSLGTFMNNRIHTKRNMSSMSSNDSADAIAPYITRPLPKPRKASKSKQVEFSASTIRRSDGHSTEDARRSNVDHQAPQPSPRRLRSRDRPTTSTDLVCGAPGRNAKGNTRSTDDEDRDTAEKSESDESVDQLEESQDEESRPPPLKQRLRQRSISGQPDTPLHPPVLPMKERLRPRRRPVSGGADGDDELEEDEEDSAEGSGDEAQEGAELDKIVDEPKRLRNGKIVGEEDKEEISDEEESHEEDEGEGEMRVPEEPKRLRNGKIVGEAEFAENDDDSQSEMDIVDGEISLVDGSEESTESAESSEEAEVHGEEDEEEVDELEFDLTEATAKGLTRLRRDDLVKLCESKNLSAEGTKVKLANALIEWRDRRYNSDATSVASSSSPSSSSTVRVSATPRANGTKTAKPLLMRSYRVHANQPTTPTPGSSVLNDPGNGRPVADAEVELDLESLGLEDKEIDCQRLTKLEKIGSGGFKDVYTGELRATPSSKRATKVAIAEFRSQLTAMDIKELKLLGDFSHPNVVRFLGVSIPETMKGSKECPVMIVSELCTNGDLFDYIRNVPPPSLHKVLSLMLDIARGLQYLHLHKPSIIHRDCKSSNILITSKITAKITDFGLAKVKQSTKSMVRSLVGTVNWQAPELWSPHPKYNHKVDVFSCACVFWEMLQWHNTTKKFPWEGMNEHAVYDAVGAKKQRPPLTGLRKQWCPEVVNLIERMWAQEPQERPTMCEVVEELGSLLKEY